MSRDKKEYRRGDRFSTYIGRKVPGAVLEWLNVQDDISDAVLQAITFYIRNNGVSNISGPAELDDYVSAPRPSRTVVSAPEDTIISPPVKKQEVPKAPVSTRPPEESVSKGQNQSAWAGVNDVVSDDDTF